MRTIFFILSICLAMFFGIIFGIQIHKGGTPPQNFKEIIYPAKKIENSDSPIIFTSNNSNSKTSETTIIKREKTKLSNIGTKTDNVISNLFTKLVKIFE